MEGWRQLDQSSGVATSKYACALIFTGLGRKQSHVMLISVVRNADATNATAKLLVYANNSQLHRRPLGCHGM